MVKNGFDQTATKDDVTTIKKDITGINSRLSGIQARLDDIADKMAKKDDVKNLEKRVAVLEEN